MTSRPEDKANPGPRRYRVIILRDHQELSDLDLWPNDEVWDQQYGLLGRVNDEGVFVGLSK